jgi:uncharacterized protein (DUF885 family)
MTNSQSPSELLAAVAAEYWERRLEADPIEAMFLGERGQDHRLPDVTPAGRERVIAALSGLLDRARGIDAAALSGSDWVTHRALLDELANDLAVKSEHLEAWTVDPRGGPHVRLMNIAEIQRPATAEQAEALVERWRAMGPYIDAHTENLRRSIANTKLPTAGATARVIEQLDELLQKPDAEWALSAPARAELAATTSTWASATCPGARPRTAR